MRRSRAIAARGRTSAGWIAGAGMLALLVAGCAAADEQAAGVGGTPAPATSAPATAPPPSPTATASPAPTSLIPEDDAMRQRVPDNALQSLIGDVVARTGVEADEVQVVSAQSRTFPDGSLGCPEPGMMYTQAVVEGWQVILSADGQQYDYRFAGRGGFKLCERPGAASGAGGTIEPRPFPTRSSADADQS